MDSIRKSEDKEMFDLFDRLEVEALEEKIVEPLKSLERTETVLSPEMLGLASAAVSPVDADAVRRIKARTLARLQGDQERNITGLKSAENSIVGASRLSDGIPSTAKRGSWRRIGIAAAVLAALLAVAGLVSAPSVQAELKKVFRFLPGIGAVEESEANQPVYVLERPYVQKIGDGELTVDGIVLERGGATVTLRGLRMPVIKEFEADIGGRTFPFISFTSASSGDWYGNYGPPQGTVLPEADSITIHFNGTTVGPLKLAPPRSADDLEQLGASDEQQEVRISAYATSLDHGQVRVQLLPKPRQSNRIISSYGVSPLIPQDGLFVEDAEGTKQELLQSEKMSSPSDFRFQKRVEGKAPYTVVIPYIEMYQMNIFSGEVTIPLPDEGQDKELDIHSEIAGFPVRFTRVFRDNTTSISLDTDVGFNPEQSRTLMNYSIQYHGSEGYASMSWENVNTGIPAMKRLHLEVKPGQDKLRFTMADPYYLVRGPWRIPINPE
jgi:hypothetical protein